MFLELKQRIYVFVSRSFNINRVATQAVEDVLSIGEYHNNIYYKYNILYNVRFLMFAVYDIKHLINIFPLSIAKRQGNLSLPLNRELVEKGQ